MYRRLASAWNSGRNRISHAFSRTSRVLARWSTSASRDLETDNPFYAFLPPCAVNGILTYKIDLYCQPKAILYFHAKKILGCGVHSILIAMWHYSPKWPS